MNRLQQLAPLAEDLDSTLLTHGDIGRMESLSVADERDIAPFSLFAPLHYESNYAYPLLAWLHGPGDDERQLKRIMPLLSMRNYVAVAPRGTRQSPRGDGRSAFGWSQQSRHEALAEGRTWDAIATAQARFHIAPDRVFIGGFDCGGTMAFRLAMKHPDRFAGVLSLGGRFPVGRNPLLKLDDARRIPVFLACGRDSRRFPPHEVCDNLRLFHSAGMAICLRQYPCGQEISPLMLADMDRWMMELVTGGKPA
jgi:phospholipase/carboxylesterase